VKPAEGMDCWKRERWRFYRQCGDTREMIGWRAVAGKERWDKLAVRRSYD